MADVRARATAFSKLERLANTVQNIDPDTVTDGQIKVYLKSADDCIKKIEESHLKILGLLTDNQAILDQEAIIDPMEALYQSVMATLYNYQATTGSSSRPMQQLRLPDIQIPSFDGKYDDWPSFSDLFKATIEKNSTLSPSQKLQYLKSCTKGEAYNLVKTFTVTDQNYKEAWKLLSQRYSNTREIVNSLVKRLICQPSIKNESIVALQSLVNTTLESLRSLQVLGRPTEHWDDLVTYIVIDKLDTDTRAEWARSLKGADPPTFTEVQEFLEQHIRTLHAKGTFKQTSNKPTNQEKHIHHISQQSAGKCQICKEQHKLYACPKLRAMQPDKRLEAVKSSGACLNCLKEGHMVRDCTSTSTCKKCSRKHNTFLHQDQLTNKPNKQIHNTQHQSQSSSSSNTQQTENINVNTSAFSNSNGTTLLKTALVNIVDSKNVKQQVRVFLDDGGEGSLIKESTLARLGLPRKRTNVTVTGVGDRPAFTSKWKTQVRLFSKINNQFIDVELYSVPQVTGAINRHQGNQLTSWNHLTGIQLADPYFQSGGDIDILIGADAVPYTLMTGLRKADRLSPVAQQTIFGWVLFGNVQFPQCSSSLQVNTFNCQLGDILRRFWEMEEVIQEHAMSPEEQKCENHFIKTHTRNQEGRFVVELPFNEKIKDLGGTKQQAQRRLMSLERRFANHPQYKKAYIDFMREYEKLGHMEKIPAHELSSTDVAYLPHHFVLKEESTTTKQRTVFDGSAKSTSGISLNDTLLVGATIQPDLFTILIRMRLRPIIIKADITKMFRQFLVTKKHCDYQRILWREDSIHPVEEYRLLTVTYGTACATFLATRCLIQLANESAHHHPLAAEALRKSFYVDDFLGSFESVEKAEIVVKELMNITSSCGVELRKWCSNKPEILKSIPESLKEECNTLEFSDGDQTVKTLGIIWEPKTDDYQFTVKQVESKLVTKRFILSEIAKTFDPLGWLAPITITAKLLLQKIWLQSTGWDQEVSEQLQQEWKEYLTNLGDVDKVRIPRCIVTSIPIRYELHGYSDSSEIAMAAAAYLKCVYQDGSVSVNLITSKTKVAPLKAVSLPKLELSAAKLLAELIVTVQQSMELPVELYCWTDSTITLRWISSHSRRWKAFVANRVSAIQSLVPPEKWHHVKGEDNPADLPSRGVTTTQLISSERWWHGPSWLKQSSYPIHYDPCNEEEVRKEERAKQLVVFHFSNNTSHSKLFAAFSSFIKLCRVSVYLRRFVEYIKNKKSFKHPEFIFPVELKQSKLAVIRWAQNVSFPEEIHRLQTSQALPSSSKLLQLNPFIDENGILRVGGRIQRAKLPNGTLHPIILSNQHPISKLIINHTHLQNFHSGFTMTLATIRREYWIIRGRDVIRHELRKCITCRRHNAVAVQQLMGNLPMGRVNATRAFLHTGVDFAGPFNVKFKRGRYYSNEKVYFAIFVCFATKAVHLESVNDLSAESFIATFERFISRRGICTHLYSDNGTNFVGADNILKDFLQQHQSSFLQQFCHRGTQWHFNTPSSPHQGGLWEAGVKSVKYHLNRVIGQSTLVLEQFQTLLCRIEACLNSRPICALSAEPSDLDALTPGHFLIGGPLTSIPEPDLTQVMPNRLSYWETIRQMSQSFWKRWSTEYVVTLQQRFKWTKKRANLQVGDLVVVMDENLPITKWKLGRVVSTNEGLDGLVRSVTVKTAAGEYQRPVTKLSPLILTNDF